MAVFSIPWTGTVTASGGNADLWEVLPGDDLPCKILGFRLGQISEVGDAMEEGLRVSILRMRATVTSGSGGSAGAPEDVSRSNQTPGFTCETNNATVATTTGDTEIIDGLGWNIRNSPYEVWFPDDRLQPKAIQGEGLFIRLQTTAADDLTFAGTLWIDEG